MIGETNMEYRQLPHRTEKESFGVLDLGFVSAAGLAVPGLSGDGVQLTPGLIDLVVSEISIVQSPFGVFEG
jgi:uncharacterized membrane protein